MYAYKLRAEGQVLECEVEGVTRPPHAGGIRGDIREWTRASRRRCIDAVLRLPWQEGLCHQMVLTFPGREHRELIPTDGVVAKKKLRKFIALLNWMFRGDLVAFWKQEFQRGRPGEWDNECQRRAVHFHLFIQTAPDLLDFEQKLLAFRLWVHDAWSRIVGAPARTSVTPWLNVATYLKCYLSKGIEKEQQNVVPDGFTNPGRFWGVVGQWGQRVSELELQNERDFYRARRVLRKLAQSRQRSFNGRRIRAWEHRGNVEKGVGCFRSNSGEIRPRFDTRGMKVFTCGAGSTWRVFEQIRKWLGYGPPRYIDHPGFPFAVSWRLIPTEHPEPGLPLYELLNEHPPPLEASFVPF